MKKTPVIVLFRLLCVLLAQSPVIAQSTKKDSLENILRTAKSDTFKSNVLTSIAKDQISYDIKKSEVNALKALQLAQKSNYKKGEAYALLALSKIYTQKGNPLAALNRIVSAIKIFEQLNNVEGCAKAYYELGYTYKETGNYEKAINSFSQSLQLYKTSNDLTNVALCQMVMGHVNADKAWISKDTAYLEKTFKLYQQALDYYKKINNPERICVSYINIANSYIGREKITHSDRFLDKSLYYSNASLKISQDILKDATRTCINFLNIGEVYLIRKQYQTAIAFYLKAYSISLKTGNLNHKLYAMQQIIMIYKEMGYYEKAIAWSDDYLKIATTVRFNFNLKEVYLWRSEIYSLQSDYKKAYQNRIFYETYADSVLNQEKAKALIESQVAFESQRKDKEIALLNKNQELQKTKLNQQGLIRNYLIGAILLTLLLLFVIYSRFKLNVRTNRIIKQKNKKLEKLSIVARETANGVFITDKDGNAEWFNEGFSKLFGWENMDEYLIKRGRNILEVSGQDNIKEIINQSINEKKSIIYDAINPTKDGNDLWVQTTLTPIFDKSGNLKNLVFVDADITELKNSEARYSSVNRELEAFSYSVSHDLRAPLRAISGYAQILKEDHTNNLEADGMNILDAILNNSRKMGELIDDLLTFSRLGRTALNTTIINMEHLVKSVLEEQIPKENDAVEVILQELLPAKGSPALITQVWVNLISNALKFSKNKTITRIEIGSYQKEGFIVYYIKDNGAGFDMEYYDKLFGVFQRLHSQDEFEGTGIGLAIIQRIVQRHNGQVWAESKLNDGSCFYFNLPIIDT